MPKGERTGLHAIPDEARHIFADHHAQLHQHHPWVHRVIEVIPRCFFACFKDKRLYLQHYTLPLSFATVDEATRCNFGLP
jgi:hypothetical protein